MKISVGRTPDKVEVFVDTDSHLVSLWGEFDDYETGPRLNTHRPKELGDLLLEAAGIRAWWLGARGDEIDRAKR